MYILVFIMLLFLLLIFGKNCKMNLYVSLSDGYLYFIKMEKSNVSLSDLSFMF